MTLKESNRAISYYERNEEEENGDILLLSWYGESVTNDVIMSKMKAYNVAKISEMKWPIMTISNISIICLINNVISIMWYEIILSKSNILLVIIISI